VPYSNTLFTVSKLTWSTLLQAKVFKLNTRQKAFRHSVHMYNVISCYMSRNKIHSAVLYYSMPSGYVL